MPNFDWLDLLENENISTVTLRWPDEGMSDGILADLDSLMNYLEDETSRSLIVLRGLNSVAPHTPSPSPTAVEHCRKWENFVVRIDRFAGASIAVIDGSCSHFRLQLALACDYRLATSRSVFRMPEVKEGYLPGMNIFRLAKYAGIGPPASRHARQQATPVRSISGCVLTVWARSSAGPSFTMAQ